MRLRLAALAALLCFCISVQAATLVTISDTLSSAPGQPSVGSINISWPTFTLPDSTVVPGGNRTVVLSGNGAFTIQLYPTDQATLAGSPVIGSVYYSVSYSLTNGQSIANKWTVPTTTQTLKLVNVLAPVSGSLRAPIGTAVPAHCTPGDIFVNQTTQYVQACIGTDTWINLVNLAQADGRYVADSASAGLVYRGTAANQTRPATGTDVTNTLGFTPVNPANAGSEYASNAAAVRTNLGILSAATHATGDFLLSNAVIPVNLIPTSIPASSITGLNSAYLQVSQLGANSGVAQLGPSGLLLSSQLPAISYSSLTNLPTLPTKLSDLTNDASYAHLSDISTAGRTGSYTDLINKPSFDSSGAAAAVQATSFQITNLFSEITTNTLRATARTNLGLSTLAATGAWADLSGKPTTFPSDWSQITNTPTIPTQLSQLTNNASYAHLSDISTAGRSGSYNDLTDKPSFATSASVAAAQAASFQITNLFSEITTNTQRTTAQTNLGLSLLAASGNWTDIQGKPSLFLSDWNTLANKPTLGTIITKNLGDYVLTTAVGANNGVAPLDGSHLVPLTNLPTIPATQTSGFAAVATTGSYPDLINKPTALPPNGSASGDLSATYPAPVVSGIKGVSLASLAAPNGGILAFNSSAVPHMAGQSDITAALGYTPLSAANAGSLLNLGSMANEDTDAFLADTGSVGIPFRTTPGVTRVATGSDLTTLIGNGAYDAIGTAAAAVAAIPTSGSAQTNPALLTPADWATFNGKLSQDPALTGDVTKGVGSTVTTLATVNSAPGACGDATHVCQVTTNGKGLVTGQSAVSIAAVTGSSLTAGNFAQGTGGSTIADSGKVIPAGAVVGTSDTQTLTNKSIDAAEVNSGTIGVARLPAFSGGDVTSSAGSGALTLPNVNTNVGSFGSSTLIPVVTVNAKGQVTAVTTATPAPGGITQLTGDATTASNSSGATASTVAKINGTSVPTNSAADQLLLTTASAVAAWASIPNCVDSSGNHLNYNTSTHAWSCGSSGGTAASAAFGALTGGTNTAAAMLVGTGSSLGPTGSGTVTANALSGVASSALSDASSLVTLTGTQTLTNKSISAGQVNSGTLPTAQLPALTGDVASSAGSASLAVNKIKGNTVPANASGCLSNDGAGVLSWAACSGSSGGAFNSLTGGTNTAAAMVVGSGASLTTSGTGSIVATGLSGVASTALSDASSLLTLTGTQTVTNKSIAASEVNSGTLAAAQLPALTGDVASSAGSAATTVNRLKGNTVPANASGCLANDGNGVLSWAACSGSTGGAFSALTGGTNTAAAMLVGTGASLGPSGSGTLTANALTGVASTALSDSANLMRTTAAVTFGANAYDVSGATHTLPVKKGTLANRPTSCTQGEVYFATDATAGQNLYYCTATDAWTQQAGGSTGSGITAITGDLAASGTGSVTGTLATVNSAPGACGDATHVCQVTTDGKGRVTNQSAVAITTSGTGTVTNTAGTLTLNKLLVGNGGADLKTGDLTGDVTTSGSTATALATTGVAAGTYGDATHSAIVTVDAKGRITNATTATITGSGGGGGAGSMPNFSASFSNSASVTLTHNLNTLAVLVGCRNASNVFIEGGAVSLTDANTAVVTFSSPQTGTCVVNGGTGVAPSSYSFTSQTSVSINHNLNTLNVITSCYSGGNVLLTPSSITLNDVNNETVTFGSSTTGRCVVVGGIGPAGATGPAGAAGVPKYSFSLTSALSYTITGSTHGLGSANLAASCRDSSGNPFTPTLQINTTNYNATISFLSAKSGGSCWLY